MSSTDHVLVFTLCEDIYIYMQLPYCYRMHSQNLRSARAKYKAPFFILKQKFIEYLKYSVYYKWQSELFIYAYDLNIFLFEVQACLNMRPGN